VDPHDDRVRPQPRGAEHVGLEGKRPDRPVGDDARSIDRGHRRCRQERCYDTGQRSCYRPAAWRKEAAVRLLERSVDRVGDAHWERVGLAMGLLACASIASQLVHELSSRTPSSLSWPFLLGFALVYAFWLLYGLRFRRMAIWLSNGVAVVLQLLLTVVAVLKG
jgi:uncharacterized protein with PQ loop repeat